MPTLESFEGEDHAIVGESGPSLRGLFAGSIFKGTQRSGRSAYDVEVEQQDVDLERSFLCGYLRISGLTEVCWSLCVKSDPFPCL